MTTNFLRNDEEIYLQKISAKTIIEALTMDDVERFVRSLGVNNIERKNENEMIIPTICHNPLEEAETMKLYWYQNYKLFHCYTECGDNMTIFELYKRFMRINYHEVSQAEAELYVKKVVLSNHEIGTSNEPIVNNHLIIDREKYKNKNQFPKNPIYPNYTLDRFMKYHHPIWLKEGISNYSMDKFNIRFFIKQNKIIIPHYDINGNLIGIRARSLNEEDIENGRKYMPIILNQQIYNHPTGQNLYGIYENQEAIKFFRRAIIVEGEKSVMLSYDYYGEDSVAVACCGHNISIYQINLLHKLGVSEVTIAFDKEYEKAGDNESKKDREHIVKLCNKYKHLMNFSYIWDFKNRLKKKQSPMDCGKQVWEELYKERVIVK